jgi:hypothetical protein
MNSKMRNLLDMIEGAELDTLDEVIISTNGTDAEVFNEGMWVNGRFPQSVRIDQPTHGVGQTHAHVYGRKGDEIGVVNIDGTPSHGTKMRLSQDDADALRGRGFKIPVNRIIEWLSLGQYGRLLLG